MLGLSICTPCTCRAIYRSMGLLTTASPCALVLVPLAYVSAIAAITSRCFAELCLGHDPRCRTEGLTSSKWQKARCAAAEHEDMESHQRRVQPNQCLFTCELADM